MHTHTHTHIYTHTSEHGVTWDTAVNLCGMSHAGLNPMTDPERSEESCKFYASSSQIHSTWNNKESPIKMGHLKICITPNLSLLFTKMTTNGQSKSEKWRETPVEQGGDCPVSGHWMFKVMHLEMLPWAGAASRSLNTILLWEIK